MAGILTALLSGALMSIQGVFNTEVTKQTSTWLAAGWVQISAFAVCLAAWCITGREPIGDLFRVKPWYLLLGGAIGAFITITVIWSMAGLGPAKAAMLIVISQLAAAWLIELFGLFGMEKTDFTVVSAARRGNWRVYHDHGYLEYGRARPGEGGDADRHFPARSGVAD